MKVVKDANEFGLDIFLKEEKKYVAITYNGNLDLYWSIHSENVNEDNEFLITKENYRLYELFEQLFDDIKNINIFNEGLDKEMYRSNNMSNYNELYNGSNVVTWYSDEAAHEVANILKIIKCDSSFKIQFYTQPYIDGYSEDFHSLHYIPIRFRNSGSRYEPFNMVFMKMYRDMKEIDDVNDYGHQLHLEEYLHNKSKVKKFY